MDKKDFQEAGTFTEDVERTHGGDLNYNVNARIANPLHGLSHDQLMEKVHTMVKDNSIEEHTELFEKAALLAQNPGNFESIPNITEEEKVFLRREKTNRWSQPWALYQTVFICSLGAAVQGWDQTGSNGANLSFPIEFGIGETYLDGTPNPDAIRNTWIVGLINAGPYICIALCSAWLTDPLNYLFGRRGTIFISGVFCTISVIGSALTQTWPQLLICRLLLGLGMGVKATTIPVFAAENTPASIRGGLVMSWQLWTAFGIFLGFCANLAVYNVGEIAWRLQLGSAFIPAIPLTIGIFFCPESPRWLMKKKNYPKAYRSFLRLRNSPIQAARDMFSIHAQLTEEYAVLHGSTYFGRAKELFTIPRVRRATLASWVVMLAQQMCGINIIAFYSSSVFVNAGYSERSALLASMGFGLINWVFAFPAVWTIDTFGRRNLLLFTFPNMAWCLLAAGFCFLIPEGSAAKVPLIAFFIYLFAAFYSPGEGPVPFTYSAEVFPLTHRELGMSWAVATCFFFAAALSITFPRMLVALSATGSFGFYAGLNVVALVMIFLWVPETKQRTLEELDYIFAVPTWTHMRYQTTVFLPYVIKKYVFFQRKTVLPPLYNLEEVESIGGVPEKVSH